LYLVQTLRHSGYEPADDLADNISEPLQAKVYQWERLHPLVHLY